MTGERPTLRFLASPTEADVDGRTISAGHVLEWIDRAGFACAAGWSGRYCVTAYVGDVQFGRAIPVGALVEVDARLVSTGRTSMQVLVTVRTGAPTGGALTRATSCLLVFVALDEQRSPAPVPQWEPEDAADRELAARAQARIPVRQRIRTAMDAQRYTAEGTAPSLVLRFLAHPTDVNWGGSVHGGTVLRWIDEAAQACAVSWTRRRTVGVYAGGIHFLRPIAIGALVEVESRVIATGPHSVHLATRVRSADPTRGVYERTTTCMSVFVPLGEDGRAGAVEPIPLVSEEDVALDRHARDLMALRTELASIGV